MAKIRTRYAPSPTGKMHVGNLRTALYEFLTAKHEDGTFIFRIEDTDQGRFVEGATEFIYRVMEKTGLTYDEGPGKEGTVGPYIQSERVKSGLYMEYAKKLVEKGEAYYCFCTKERLDSLKTVANPDADDEDDEKLIRKYDKHCLSLSKDEIEANLKAGMPFVIRQNSPTTGTTSFTDVNYGTISVDNSELDDMILIKSDGFPTYNFANVIDDHLMGITHVVRGNEYLSSTPKYTLLYKAFGWDEPTYIHLPLVTNEEHKKLSKRSGHANFEDLLEQGFLPEAIINFIALLGWSSGTEKEIFTLDELIKEFDYHHISKSPSVFDMTKLRWMNGEYIKMLDDQKYLELAVPYVKAVVDKDLDLNKIAMLVKTRIETLCDIAEKIDFFNELPEYDPEMYVHKKMKTTKESSLEVLKELLPLLKSNDDYSFGGVEKLLMDYITKKEIKNGQGLWPIRTAVSGKQMTPGGAYEIMEILGKDESIRRVEAAIDLLEKSI
ncbi:MAG: glutamate--tRNA ligase [Lachnospiraceae bacterium]|nr:glutamate--tRNA ligase [Lachnospiraceae bacterium]